jgi:16S rRNA (guanine527-N7)-methyltransferase
MAERDFREVLVEQAARIGTVLPASVIEGCATHYALMVRWNGTHNLTRVSSPEDAAVRHYLDCALPALMLAPTAPARFLDIGSGAGFPGLVAALAWPGVEAGLVEPARKRASFLLLAAGVMGLRAEVHVPGARCAPLVLSRATFSDGAREKLWPYVERGGRLVVWSTNHELSAWERTVSTWEGAILSSWGYALPGVEDRLVVSVVRAL